MKELFKEIKEFQEEYFPQSNALSKSIHLKEEINELLHELNFFYSIQDSCNQEDIRMEYADCFLLLIGSAQAYGMTYEDVEKAIKDKIEINKNRKWGVPNEYGVVSHIKE